MSYTTTKIGFDYADTASFCSNSNSLELRNNCGNCQECASKILNCTHTTISCRTSDHDRNRLSSATLNVNLETINDINESVGIIRIYYSGKECFDAGISGNEKFIIQMVNTNIYNYTVYLIV